MEKPPTKYKWKKQLKVAIDQHWSLIWTEECCTKSALKVSVSTKESNKQSTYYLEVCKEQPT
jgi:hypothetical protein